MTRIISGFAKSLRLAVPRTGTRPTSDLVREAIFSSLAATDTVPDARVLDLYAGSGALGLEAASRGATEVVLVDRAAAAAATCRKNAAAITQASKQNLKITVPKNTPAKITVPKITVRQQAVQTFLASAPTGWHVVFVDPPYELDNKKLASVLAMLPRLLAGYAVVVVERSSRSPEPQWPHGLIPTKHRRYGETTIWWAQLTTHEKDQPAAPSQDE